jgi:hypothetical protein
MTKTWSPDPVIVEARDAIQLMNTALLTERSSKKLRLQANFFEDTMNGLSGKINNLSVELRTEIQTNCASIVASGEVRSIEFDLYKTLLPEDLTEKAATHYVTGKKLYPLTTSVKITAESSDVSSNAASAPVATKNVRTTKTKAFVTVVDPIFATLDATAAAVVESPLALDQNATSPILPSGMIALAKEAAANANGLQAGLTVFSHNPLATIVVDTQDLLLYYTDNNYANLNVALAVVYANSSLTAEYKTLRESVGGPDGLSGGVSQLSVFKDHTDRIAGLVLASDSPNAEETGDSTDEFLNLNDFSGGPTVIFDFDSRKFRSAKYTIQATAAQTDRGHQVNEIYILHDNYHPYTREVASVYSEDPFMTYTTRLLNNKVEVLATTTVANTDFVIHGTRLRIARVAESFEDMSQTEIVSNHEIVSSYLDDGVDYVQLQSESLLHPEAVGKLARDFRDMLNTLASDVFNAQSTATKQASILAYATLMITRRATIQALIDSDYTNFIATRKLVEALEIAYKLTQAYTDDNGNAIPRQTLNTVTIQAIEAEM